MGSLFSKSGILCCSVSTQQVDFAVEALSTLLSVSFEVFSDATRPNCLGTTSNKQRVVCMTSQGVEGLLETVPCMGKYVLISHMHCKGTWKSQGDSLGGLASL